MNNQSTIVIFSNKHLLTDIQKVNTRMEVRSTGGTITTRLKGNLPNYGLV